MMDKIHQSQLCGTLKIDLIYFCYCDFAVCSKLKQVIITAVAERWNWVDESKWSIRNISNPLQIVMTRFLPGIW